MWGINVSGSVFKPVSVYATDIATTQAIPHPQITGPYFLERKPGGGSGSFLHEGENEFTFIPGDTATVYGGISQIKTDGGSDATTWGDDITHLRP